MKSKAVFSSFVLVCSVMAPTTSVFAQNGAACIEQANPLTAGTQDEPCKEEAGALPQLPQLRPDPAAIAQGVQASVDRAADLRFGTDSYDDVILNGRRGKDMEHSSASVFSSGIVPGTPGMDLDPAAFRTGAKQSLATTDADNRGLNMWVGFGYGGFGFWDGGETASHGLVSLNAAMDPRQPAPGPNGLLDGTTRLDTAWVPDADGRNGRREYLGVIRAPGFTTPVDKDGRVMPDEFGLFLDQPSAKAREHYAQLDPSIYGYQSPLIGIRMHKNPAFDPESPHYDADAVALWNSGLEDVTYKDPETGEPVVKQVNTKYYEDQAYYGNPKLKRPWLTELTCGFCHVADNPINPAADPDHPKMENLTSMNGQPYLRERFFVYSRSKPDDFVMQMENQIAPGTNDTSFFIPMDHRRNHKQLNGTPELAARAGLFLRRPNPDGKGYTETFAGVAEPPKASDSEEYKDFFKKRMVLMNGESVEALRRIPGNPYEIPDGVTEYYIPSPYVLAGGGDRGGIHFAAWRVPHNIGLAWQQTMRKSNPLVGLRDQAPMSMIEPLDAGHGWSEFTLNGINDEIGFLLKSPSFRLTDHPNGDAILAEATAHPKDSEWGFKSDADKVDHGKTVFADKCAHCHSSKTPAFDHPNQRQAWQELVHSPDFLDKNYMSSDLAIPVTDVKTWSTRAFATNAISAEGDPDGDDGDLWYNWTSQTYRDRRTVGPIRQFDLATGKQTVYTPTMGGGTGYYRVNPLNHIWARGGFMNSKEVGGGSNDPVLDAEIQRLAMSADINDRIKFYNISMDQMLNPETRRGEGSILRTQGNSVLRVPGTVIPALLRKLARSPEFPWDGKSIDATLGLGINRMHIPNQDTDGDGQPDLGNRWPFRIGMAPSQLVPGQTALVLDYESATCADAPADYAPCKGCAPNTPVNPKYIQQIHDEVRRIEVTIGSGAKVPVFLGPAMWKNAGAPPTEVLWFALAPRDGSDNYQKALDVLAAKSADELRELFKASSGPADAAQAKQQLTELSGQASGYGQPKGMMLAFNNISQGATDGPLHAILAAAGLDKVPSLDIPVPEGTPIDLILNVTPWRMKPVLDKLLESRGAGALTMLQQFQNLPEARQKAVFDRIIAPLLQQASAGSDSILDRGHPYGVLAGRPGATPDDPAWEGDPETNSRPYHPQTNPNGVLSDRDKEALRAYGLRW